MSSSLFIPHSKASRGRATQGFTLIELSIVLVIIGLIIGGVLVGQDLIKSAQTRAIISQFEKYNSAVNTFRTKYAGIPGDLQSTAAASYGLFAETTNGGTVGHGDGNGIVEGGAANSVNPIGETLVFWRHLTDADLIDGAYGTIAGTSAIDPATGLVSGDSAPSQSIPPIKGGGGSSIIVYSASGSNYYQLMPVTQVNAAGTYSLGSAGISPLDSHNIDTKLDDAMPNTGIVEAKALSPINTLASHAASATNGTCTVGTGISTDIYDLDPSHGATDTSCSLQFRFN